MGSLTSLQAHREATPNGKSKLRRLRTEQNTHTRQSWSTLKPFGLLKQKEVGQTPCFGGPRFSTSYFAKSFATCLGAWEKLQPADTTMNLESLNSVKNPPRCAPWSKLLIWPTVMAPLIGNSTTAFQDPYQDDLCEPQVNETVL